MWRHTLLQKPLYGCVSLIFLGFTETPKRRLDTGHKSSCCWLLRDIVLVCVTQSDKDTEWQHSSLWLIFCSFSYSTKHIKCTTRTPSLPSYVVSCPHHIDHYSSFSLPLLSHAITPQPPPSLLPSSQSCHPEQSWDDGSIPKRPDESRRRRWGQHGRMSRGQQLRGGSDGNC